MVRSRDGKPIKIEISPSDGIEIFEPIAREFMRAICGLEPGEYLLTDESDLRDFRSFAEGGQSLADLQKKIRETYLLDDVPNKLVDLFRLLQHRTRGSQ